MAQLNKIDVTYQDSTYNCFNTKHILQGDNNHMNATHGNTKLPIYSFDYTWLASKLISGINIIIF